MKKNAPRFWGTHKVVSGDVPQANRLDLIVRLVCESQNWPMSSSKIAKALDYEPRQGAYYAAAGEMLGFLERQSGKWQVAPRGRAFCTQTATTRKSLLLEYVLRIPVLSLALLCIEEGGVSGRSIKDVANFLADYTELDKVTCNRRASTLVAWLEHVEVVTRNTVTGIVYHRTYSPQAKLDL